MVGLADRSYFHESGQHLAKHLVPYTYYHNIYDPHEWGLGNFRCIIHLPGQDSQPSLPGKVSGMHDFAGTVDKGIRDRS